MELAAVVNPEFPRGGANRKDERRRTIIILAKFCMKMKQIGSRGLAPKSLKLPWICQWKSVLSSQCVHTNFPEQNPSLGRKFKIHENQA